MEPKKVELTKQQVLEMGDVIDLMANFDGPMKFIYALGRTKWLIAGVLSAIREAIKVPRRFQEFVQKRAEKAKHYAKKDEKGSPIISSNSYVIEDQSAFENDAEKLKKEYQDSIDKYEAGLDGRAEFMQEKVLVEVYCFPLQEVLDSKPREGSIKAIVEDPSSDVAKKVKDILACEPGIKLNAQQMAAFLPMLSE